MNRPIRSLILQFARELRGMGQEELGAKVGYEKKSAISALERGKEDPGPETLERLMGALGVSPSTLDALLAIAEEIRDVEIEDRWIGPESGPVLVTGKQLRIAEREAGRYANVMRRNFHQHLLEAYVLSETEERESGRQAGNGNTPESVS
jgi:transcriptional regulator with XRE-family HTH domain